MKTLDALAAVVLDMVEQYKCPQCGAILIGDPIPEDQRHLYGGELFFSRKIGNSNRDRITHWSCPDCGHVWERQ